jgi:ankyrin repeat protein
MQGKQEPTGTSSNNAKATPTSTPAQQYSKQESEQLWKNLDDETKVTTLLKSKADPNHVNFGLTWNTWSCLAYAVHERNEKITGLLLDAKADPNCKVPSNSNTKSSSLLEMAVINTDTTPNDSLVHLLLNAGATCQGSVTAQKTVSDWLHKYMASIGKVRLDALSKYLNRNDIFIYIIKNQSIVSVPIYHKHSLHVMTGNGGGSSESKDLVGYKHEIFLPNALHHIKELLNQNDVNPNQDDDGFPLLVTVVKKYAIALAIKNRSNFETCVYYNDPGYIIVNEFLCESYRLIAIAWITNIRFDTNILRQNLSELGGGTLLEYIRENCAPIYDGALAAATAAPASKHAPQEPQNTQSDKSTKAEPTPTAQSSISPEEQNKIILQAAAKGDLAQLQGFHKQGMDLKNIRDAKRNTVLHLAASAGATHDLINFLIDDCHCDYDALNAASETPLYCAVTQRREETVTALLTRTPSPDLKRQYPPRSGETIVTIELRGNREPPLIGRLIRNIANPNQPLPDEQLPVLHMAAHHGNVRAIECLGRDARINVNEPNSSKHYEGLTPIMHAAFQGHEKAVTALLALDVRFDGDNEQEKKMVAPENTQINAPIKTLLSRHATKRKHQTTLLVNSIFIALFVDARNEAQARQSFPTVTALLFWALRDLPTMPTIARRLNVEKTTEDDFKKSEGSRIFGIFMGYRLYHHHHANAQKSPANSTPIRYRALTLDDKQKWLRLLNNTKDQKQKEQFRDHVHAATKDYLSLPTNNQVQLENIAAHLMEGFDLKGKVNSDELEKWVKEVLNDPSYADKIPHDTKDEEELVRIMRNEIEFSLDETINTKRSSNTQTIYTLRVKAAFDQWLYKHNILNDQDKTAYEIAKYTTEKLGASNKKDGLERRLIKDFLLNHPDRENFFLHFRECEDPEQSKFVQVMADEMKREDRLGLSREPRLHTNYRDRLRVAVGNWVYSENIDPPSVSAKRTPSARFFASPSKHSPAANIHKDNANLSRNQTDFISWFCHEFGKLYCVYIALTTPDVQRKEGVADRMASVAEKYIDAKIAIPGIEIPVGAIAGFITQWLVSRTDNAVKSQAKRVDWLFRGCHDLLRAGEFVKHAGEYLACRYERQLNTLNIPMDIQKMARGMAERAMQYVTISDQNLYATNPSLFRKLVGAISNLLSSRVFLPVVAPTFQEPVAIIFAGILGGTSSVDDEPIGPDWRLGSVPTNTGLLIKDENSGLWKPYTRGDLEPAPNGLPLYGFCYGTIEEAKARGYTLRDDITLESIEQNQSTPNNNASRQTTSPPRGRSVDDGTGRADPAAVAAATAAAASAAASAQQFRHS